MDSKILGDAPSLRESLSAARKRAWETRRAKYGDQGHKGIYGRAQGVGPAAVARALEEISVARRYFQILLPSRYAHLGITALDLAEHALGEPLQPSTAIALGEGSQGRRVTSTSSIPTPLQGEG